MSDASSLILRQVLRGLALNREPGWNFPGNFFELSFDELGTTDARLSLQPGPHCILPDGQASIAAVCILADVALAIAMRGHAGYAMRMATVTLALQFTGAPRRGPLEAVSHFDGLHDGLARSQGLARAELTAGGQPLCTVHGSFQMLDDRSDLPPIPLRKRGVSPEPQMLTPDMLDTHERAIYEHARQAVEPGAEGFEQRFWGIRPHAHPGGATGILENGPHVGNRVGHTQGGLTFALAAQTAQAALGDDWNMVGISTWYVRPGTGAALRAAAEIAHQGGTTAVVKVDVKDEDGRLVLAAMANLSRRAAQA
ncbi:hotdog domain-containing protein [Bordetella genomosp. 13]|uniref:hotdog domain-containing protein n=1 Tax=Bordetella genomosp. 13 TaxID=463040 RepID=UPI0011A1D848|nr:hotdog domain-containing protein [Bordetella genomosp. 13]